MHVALGWIACELLESVMYDLEGMCRIPSPAMALEPVAHYIRLNNYFNKQQGSSWTWLGARLWTVLERRAHNTIFQISIKTKCWESCLQLPVSPYSAGNSRPAYLPISKAVDLLQYVFNFWLFRNINISFYGIQLACLSNVTLKGTQVYSRQMFCKRLQRLGHLEECVGKSIGSSVESNTMFK